MSANNSEGSDANTLYWSKTEETLAAWHPATCTIGSGSGTGEVSITNQSFGFGTLENILYAPATSYTYSSSGSVAFTFRHALAKVKVTLQKEPGKNDFTDTEISDASVTFMGYTAGSLGYGGMTGSGDNGEITSKKETPSGGATTYTALLIPQRMLQNKPFIKVTIGADAAARDYYYIPTGDNDANLEAGKQYNYTITVKKTGLQVESVSASWAGDGSVGSGNATEPTFQVYLPENHNLTADNMKGITQVGTSSTVYAISDKGNSFSISYTVTDDNKAKGFFIAKGIGEYTLAISGDNANGQTYTFSYNNIRSDIQLDYASFVDYAQVGYYYYYYSNGICVPNYISGISVACVGIVFKVGAGESDNVSNYPASTFTDNVIHGYAVALNNTGTDCKSWGNISSVTLSMDNEKFYGYSNTQAIKNANDYSETNFWACNQAVNYASDTPISGTSGWYLPSLGEYNALWQAYGTIQGKLTSAGGTDMKISYGFYWTSSKKNSSVACVDFGAWSSTGSFTNAIRTDNAYVRPVLTF